MRSDEIFLFSVIPGIEAKINFKKAINTKFKLRGVSTTTSVIFYIPVIHLINLFTKVC